MRRLAMAAILAVLSVTAMAAEGPRGYVRYPAIHGDTVVFTAEGDLWKVGIGGGVAQRLTSHPGRSPARRSRRTAPASPSPRATRDPPRCT